MYRYAMLTAASCNASGLHVVFLGLVVYIYIYMQRGLSARAYMVIYAYMRGIYAYMVIYAYMRGIYAYMVIYAYMWGIYAYMAVYAYMRGIYAYMVVYAYMRGIYTYMEPGKHI